MRALLVALLVLPAIACEGTFSDRGPDRGRVITPLADAELREPKSGGAGAIVDAGKPDVGPEVGSDAMPSVVLPPIDDACTVDTDCTVVAFETSGPHLCCPSCATTPVSKKWEAKARICHLLLKKACYALACPLGSMKPKCVAGHCTAVP